MSEENYGKNNGGEYRKRRKRMLKDRKRIKNIGCFMNVRGKKKTKDRK